MTRAGSGAAGATTLVGHSMCLWELVQSAMGSGTGLCLGVAEEQAVGAAGCNTQLHWEWRRQLQPDMQQCGHGHCQPELG